MSTAPTRRYRPRKTKPRAAPNPQGSIGVHPPEVQTVHQPPRIAQHISEKRFNDAPISQESKTSIEYEFMTDVQAVTLEHGIAGSDLLVQAKTGTGKTLAFLLPLVERLKNNPPTSTAKISILILSPTRELALQIEEEAKSLLRHHPFKASHAIGGTNIRSEHAHLTSKRCDILVATPGRLIDLVNTYRLQDMFTDLRAFVLDECDRLLDSGFKPQLDQIVNIIDSAATSSRQTLLFSATISDEIKQIASKALRPGYQFLSTLSDEDLNVHEHVPQTYINASFKEHLPTLLSLLKEDLSLHPTGSKPIVFFPTAKHAAVAAAVLKHVSGIPHVLEMHSRLSQSARMKTANFFRDAQSAVLLSSDVSARGMDFPLVTLVAQVGLPSDPDQYIHRLGRTARGGSTIQSRGILVLAPDESAFFLEQPTIKDLKITKHPELNTVPTSVTEITRALSQTDLEVKSQAYRAWLGYYNTYKKKLRWSSQKLVDMADDYVREALGWQQEKLPPIFKKTLNQMGGMSGVVGLNIEAPPQRAPPRKR